MFASSCLSYGVGRPVTDQQKSEEMKTPYSQTWSTKTISEFNKKAKYDPSLQQSDMSIGLGKKVC